MDKDLNLDIGIDGKAIISKIYGPTVFADIKVEPSIEKGGWVISRQAIDTAKWVEQCVIPAQLEGEFD